MKILVTGGAGQLGESIRKISGQYPCHTFIYIDLPKYDISDSETMKSVISSHRPEMIINCAAYTAVDRAESDEQAAYRANATGAEVMAALSKQHAIKLIHISTDYVFDGAAHTPYREDSAVSPRSVYGRTKLEGERAIAASGCDAAVIRTSWLYSEFGNNFVKTMLRIGGERSVVSVVSDQIGSPTYAEDLARAIMTVAEHGVTGFEIYHYSNAGAISWYEFAKAIFRHAGMEVTVRPIATADYPTAATRPAYSVLDTTKIQSLGATVPTWEESLKRCVKKLGY
jgi:dTDP-4-dehydrorhamnose reductase